MRAAVDESYSDEGDCPEVEIPEGAVYGEFQIVNKKGLHARATAKFVQCASNFESDITVTRCGETVGATSIMGILTLGAGIGSTITVVAKGTDAKAALQALAALVADRFGEGE
ncbi:HPr family phosphocarrier protein [Bosea caraganae]|uniref:HPr family phosphocarrier protein n=1 Tax=Bosea caraganae TaxID=2763117 RepID=A0A370L8K4_9HYPH|nr:HPr family phosphocarrier protein [Bosea caraganae]RDJ26721.1 HPr family phosphocarrier protein [Bosea caraganae]RDJ30608.1 HPr family phosphocarrier protein [Bosea caraganae]